MTQTLWSLELGMGRPPVLTPLAEEYVPQASGGMFVPVAVPAPGMFTYLQSRRIVYLDPTSGRARHAPFTTELDELPVRAAFVTRDPPVLVVESHDTAALHQSELGVRLRAVDLAAPRTPRGELRRVAPADLARPLTWDAGAGLVVSLADAGSGPAVYDLALRPQLGHPLLAQFATMAREGWRIFDLRLHPTEPWALLAAESGEGPADVGLWIARWDGLATPTWLLRVPRGAVIELVGFSQNGMWVAYWASYGRDIGLYVQRLSPAAAPLLLLADAHDDVNIVWLAGSPALALIRRGAFEFSIWWLPEMVP